MSAVNLGRSRQLTVVFLAVVVPAAATLVWLGLRLFEQDRILYAQREVERQAANADSVVRVLSQHMVEAERRLAEGNRLDGTVLLRRTVNGVAVEPRSLVAWWPASPAGTEVPSAPFAQAELLEFGGSASRALSAYNDLAQSASPAIRAGALIRTARIKRQQGHLVAAMSDYRRLSTVEGILVEGMPVDLLARRALCELSAPGAETFAPAVQALEQDFLSGRWALPRDAWELVAADLTRWTKRSISPTVDQAALSAAAGWFHRATTSGGTTRILVADDGVLVTVLRREVNGEDRAVAIAPSTLNAWVVAAAEQASVEPGTLSLLDERGDALAGTRAAPGKSLVTRLPAETGLPWALVLAPGQAGAVAPEFQSRQRLLAAGLGAMGLLLAGGAFLLWRVVQREMAIGRLQAEFVAAVSHEFRTPVTSLRHVIELLQEDDELTREKRASFYEVLSRSTERLHRLVESLLDFSRMEHGRKPYDLQALDPASLVTGVVRDFQADAASRNVALAITVAPGTPREIRADAAAIGHALWNLLDNAVKYSPDGKAISVSVGPHRSGVGICVADEGIGIPSHERGEIFAKFVRGEQAGRLGIKGTGVGLAIVTHIMRAHGGSVELESTPGRGSTFRLVLPAAS
jgi:signal transduction histidine kinase